jgi:hypothetical protein
VPRSRSHSPNHPRRSCRLPPQQSIRG